MCEFLEEYYDVIHNYFINRMQTQKVNIGLSKLPDKNKTQVTVDVALYYIAMSQNINSNNLSMFLFTLLEIIEIVT